jgi:pimeloyl-ACP methyl ester carboxylesterase
MHEEVIEMKGSDGKIRRGILCLPHVNDASATAALLLMPSGLKYHIGPHRWNVKLARALCQAGVASLRFDPLGVGESDESLATATTRTHWRFVEQGGFVDDTLLAAQVLQKRLPNVPVVAVGLCGGAVTAQLAAAKRPDLIMALVSLNTAITLSPLETQPAPTVSHSRAQHHFKNYAMKVFSKAAWQRVFRGESDIRGILRVLGTVALTVFHRKKLDTLPSVPNENPGFMQSFRALEQRALPHLLVFSGNDNRWLDFQEGVLSRYLRGERAGVAYEIKVVADANHEIHYTTWQQQTLDAIREWIAKTFNQGGFLTHAV